MEKKPGLLKRLIAAAEELLYPEDVTCLCCSRALGEDEYLHLCPVCAAALDELAAAQKAREDQEMSCRIEGISAVHAAFVYDAQVKRLIRLLKYESVLCAAKPLAAAMSELDCGGAEMIVPVPVDPLRLKKRGYNQSLVLSGLLSKRVGIPVSEALVRTQIRSAQTPLSAEERKTNLKGCMAVSLPVSGKRILLVDDVVTTGSTLLEGARALREAGASEIVAFAAARAGAVLKEDTEPFPMLYVYKNRGFSSRIHGKL